MPVNDRAYFPSTGTPAVSPAFESWWTNTSDAVRLPLGMTTPTGTPFATFTSAGTYMPPYVSSTVYARVLLAQYISAPMVAGSSLISQVGQWLLRAYGSITGGANPKQNFAFAYKYVSEDGVTSRGSHRYRHSIPATNANPWTGSIAVYNLAAPSVNHSASWTAQNNDRLVIEIGYSVAQLTSNVVTAYSGSVEFGDADSVDLDLSVNAQDNPWDYTRFPGFAGSGVVFNRARYSRPIRRAHVAERLVVTAAQVEPFLNEAQFNE